MAPAPPYGAEHRRGAVPGCRRGTRDRHESRAGTTSARRTGPQGPRSPGPERKPRLSCGSPCDTEARSGRLTVARAATARGRTRCGNDRVRYPWSGGDHPGHHRLVGEQLAPSCRPAAACRPGRGSDPALRAGPGRLRRVGRSERGAALRRVPSACPADCGRAPPASLKLACSAPPRSRPCMGHGVRQLPGRTGRRRLCPLPWA